MLEKNKTKTVGYWHSQQTPEYPIPEENGLGQIDAYDKNEIVRAIERVEMRAKKSFYRGWSTCRICECHNGNAEYSHEGFTWPEGYLHYIKAHNVKPDEEFMKMVYKELEKWM